LQALPLLIVGFEMIMLGMLTAAFLGVFVDSRFPSYESKEYVSDVSDGKIAVLFNCPVGKQAKFEQAMQSVGAESVKVVEAQQL
jgi:hypothetical protein